MDKKKLEDLAVGISHGSNPAFETLYRETSRGIFAFLYAMVRNRWDAEDLTQETYLKVKMNIGQYRAGTNFRAWMFQIAKNLALNYMKASSRVSPLLGEVADAETPADTCETNLFFEDLKRVLTEEEYKIVVLHDVSGFRHREIAALMEMPTGTVTWMYSRAVKKIKKFMKEDDG